MVPVKVLLVEPNPQDALALKRALEEADSSFMIEASYTPEEGLGRLRKGGYGLTIINCAMSRLSGREFVATVLQEGLLSPILVLAGPGEETAALETLHAGALDFMLRQEALRPGVLAERAHRALAHSRLMQERESLLRQLKEKNSEVEKMNRELLDQQRQLLNLAGELKRLNDELRESDRVKSGIVSMASHELRTPMTAVREGIGLILDGMLGPVSDEQKRFLTLSKNNLVRLSDLINRFLDWSKLEAGKMIMQKAPVDLREVVHEVGDSLFALLKEKSLSFHERMDGLPAALADRNWMIHVLTNLIGNAAKFTPPGGSVAVEARLSPHGTFPRMIEVSVSDTGEGIAPEELDKVFDAFYQVRRADRPAIRGTGLGLYISQLVVERHGGRIWAESPVTADGKGSRFVFTLPVSPEAAFPFPETSPPGSGGTSAHRSSDRLVLVVDDEPDLVEVLKARVESWGFRAEGAYDGPSAIEAARRLQPDLVILDYMLPKTDGVKVCEAIKSVEGKKPRVIMITVHRRFKDLHGEMSRVGVDEVLFKPFESGQLETAIRNLLSV